VQWNWLHYDRICLLMDRSPLDLWMLWVFTNILLTVFVSISGLYFVNLNDIGVSLQHFTHINYVTVFEMFNISVSRFDSCLTTPWWLLFFFGFAPFFYLVFRASDTIFTGTRAYDSFWDLLGLWPFLPTISSSIDTIFILTTFVSSA
jgi:hypothetical protein